MPSSFLLLFIQFAELAHPSRVEAQTMYFSQNYTITHSGLDSRILSATDGLAENASILLDRMLQPRMKLVKSTITNAKDLIHILQDVIIPKGFYLVSVDIKSLHTNITHDEAITTLLRRSKSHRLEVYLLDLQW